MESTRVESAGEVAFGKVEEQREACRGGGNEEGGEGGGGVVVCFEGGSGGANSSESEGNQESANSGRCDAFYPVEMGRM